MSMYDRDWYREDYRNKQRKHSRNTQSSENFLISIILILATLLLSAFLSIAVNHPFGISVCIVNIIVFLLIKQGILSQNLGCSYFSAIRGRQYWRLVTSAYTHYEPYHILMNLVSAYNLCEFLEPQIGSVMCAVVYFTAMILGGLLSCAIHNKRDGGLIMSIGASGAIYGLFGACTVILVLSYGIAGFRSIAFSLILLVLMTFNKYIDSIGHFSGFIIGIVFGLIICLCRLQLGV